MPLAWKRGGEVDGLGELFAGAGFEPGREPQEGVVDLAGADAVGQHRFDSPAGLSPAVERHAEGVMAPNHLCDPAK